MNNAQIMVLGMVCRLKPDHVLMQGVWNDSDIVRAFTAGATRITKDDLFTVNADGKSVFEHTEIWNAFPQILAMLEENGERLSPEDLGRMVGDTKPLSRFAEKQMMLEKIFVPHVWKGQAERMENAWFSYPLLERNKYDFEKIRRDLAHAEGRQTREEQLERMSVSADRIRSSVRLGELADVKAMLEKHGDYLRREDIFLRDHKNETALDSFAAWNTFDIWMKELKENSELPHWHDWLVTRADSISPLKKALEFGVAWKIFKPEFWTHNPADMLKLYEHLPADKRDAVNINETMNAIMNANFADRIETQAINTREALLRDMDGAAMPGPEGKPFVVQPVMLEKVWRNIEQVRLAMQAQGDDIRMDDLRQRKGFLGDSLMHIAIRHGQLDTVMDIAKKSGDVVSYDDLTAKNLRGQSPLDDIILQGRVKTVMRADLWVGRVGDMLKLWQVLPSHAQKDIDFPSIHAEANRLSLRRALQRGPRCDAA